MAKNSFVAEVTFKLTLNFAKFLRTCFLQTTSGRLLLEKQWILLKVNPLAIANNISKANYQNEFVLHVF